MRVGAFIMVAMLSCAVATPTAVSAKPKFDDTSFGQRCKHLQSDFDEAVRDYYAASSDVERQEAGNRARSAHQTYNEIGCFKAFGSIHFKLPPGITVKHKSPPKTVLIPEGIPKKM
jgi:hypothetical protein